MRYPENLKIGDTIGICAPSDGITEPDKIIKLNKAIENLQKMGYKVIETKSVRKSIKGRSNTASERAKEFMELWKNDEVKLILYAGGGDFLMEMLEEIDFELLKKLPPKWTQGFSDITMLSFPLNTICDIPSIYCDGVKDYAMNPLCRNLLDCLKLVSGEDVIQHSFEKHSDGKEENIDYTYNMVLETKWKNLKGEKEVTIEGRAIGGCLDCIDNLIGTKYDNTKNYIEKYNKDGIIWFLESCETSTPQLVRILLKMKYAGYFENCKGIIFGRPLIIREDYEITEDEAIMQAIGNLNFPIISGADLGHIPPQLGFMQGAILKITARAGKGTVETFRK